MTISVAQQAAALTQAICLGFGVGLLYDLLRILRVRLRLPFLGTVLDFSFWIAVTVLLFVWSQSAWGGQVRLYGAAFLFIGAGTYFWLLSRWALKIGYFFADLVEIGWNLLTYPLTLGKRLWKKVKKVVKNIFHSGTKWYRINQITEY